MSLLSLLRQRLAPGRARHAAPHRCDRSFATRALAAHSLAALSLVTVASPALLTVAIGPARAQPAPATSFFSAAELDGQRFLVVAAPIGTSSRFQLNIYEQVTPKRPCFAVTPGRPAQVNPLLGSFDFTGICGRYIDGNGYSLRVGGSDLATVYRLSVLSENGDTVLMALPTRSGAGPEMVVARAYGQGSGFLKLELEPGWRLMRRQFRGRNLGHVYVYRDSWPAGAAAPGTATPVAPSTPAAGSAAPASGQALPAPVPAALPSRPLPGVSKPAVRPLPPMPPR